MVIERGASNTLVVMARETLSPSYWLLHFNDPDRNGNAYCIVQAGNATGAFITLTFSEVASGAVATSGQVTLSPPGNWQVTIYEQTSSSNLNTANANRLVYTQAIFVEGGAGAETGWTDECPSTGDECDPLTVEVNGTTYGTLADPCGATFDVDVVQDGAPVGSLVGGEWVIPSCGDLSIGINGGDGTITVPDPCGASVSISVTQGGVEVGSYAGDNEWEIPVCDPVILTINNQSFGQIDDPCGVTLGIEVVDEDDVAVGSLTGGGKWEIPDADVTFDGLPVGDVAPGQTLNLDCGTLLDGAYVSDGGSVTGNYFVTGMLNGREVYTKDVDHNLEYTGTRWRLVKPGSDVDAALGSETYPWQADWSATSVTVEQATIGSYCGGDEVPCADLTIAINGTTYGTVTDPCGATAPVDVHDSNGNDVGSLVSGSWVVAAPANVLREYTASDTWNKPTSPSFVGAFVVCVGAGAGGACGDRLTGNAVQNTGGSGGGGGWVVWDFIAAASLGGTESVTVPTGGAGQPGRNTDGIGIAGANGGDASFGTHVIALGGRGGNGNSALGRDIAGCTPRRGSNILAGHPSMRYGNNLGAAGFYWPSDGVPVYSASNSRAPGGAPGGNGGIRAAGIGATLFGAGRVGGTVWDGTALTGGGTGAATVGGNGGSGTGNIVLTLLSSYGLTTTNGAGGGGGGGASSNATTTEAGNGGNGAIGAGGGGGGCGVAGVGDGISGDGGNGGDGIVYVYEIYKI